MLTIMFDMIGIKILTIIIIAIFLICITLSYIKGVSSLYIFLNSFSADLNNIIITIIDIRANVSATSIV